MRRGRPEGGFTLLEVLIAFLIAALALGALFQTAVAGVNAVRLAGFYSTALALARSHLALVGASPLRDQESEGDDGAFHWWTRVAAAAESARPTGLVDQVRQSGQMVPVLYRVTVAVEWRSRDTPRRITLETSRLGFEAPWAAGP